MSEERKPKTRKKYVRGDKSYFRIPQYATDEELNYLNSMHDLSAEVWLLIHDRVREQLNKEKE